MRIIVIKTAVIVIALAMLSGCSGMNGHFGCNATAGSSCTPVTQVNARANAGNFNYETSGGGRVQLPTSQIFSYATQSTGYQGVTPIPGEPVRVGEQVQRIWIAPYQDLSNNYHEPSYVYTVLERSHWMGVPAHEIKTTQTEQDD
jgi:type IV conjugative transfer system lipoprotein TraV